jgi:predicted short-subunit dehydrogenase-like oxidoreductase (DUF2520 family)
MIKVVLLGSGNVAYHLALALKSADNVEIIQRYSRNAIDNDYFDPALPCTNSLTDLKEADVYIIAVKDEVIASFSGRLSRLKGLVVHTSGSIPLSALHKDLRKGVLYPVQSLTINQPIRFKEIPLVIESERDQDFALLHELASTLSDKVFMLNSKEREKLHISAVFANNFSNYMFTCAEALCVEHNISFDILKPMIFETVKKLQYLDPLLAQTGPARRNDQAIIKKHVETLAGDKKKIYKIVSEAITNTYQIKK